MSSRVLLVDVVKGTCRGYAAGVGFRVHMLQLCSGAGQTVRWSAAWCAGLSSMMKAECWVVSCDEMREVVCWPSAACVGLVLPVRQLAVGVLSVVG